MAKELPRTIKDFITYMETIRGKSPATVSEYSIDLILFFEFIKKKNLNLSADISDIEISDIDLDFIKKISLSDIYDFLSYMSRERSAMASTRARKISSIKAFFKYLTIKANLLEHNPCETLESPKKRVSIPKYLSLEQSFDLLSAPEGDNKERDFCMLILFLTCGMRLSELVGLNLKDIYDDHIKVLGKGNKERIIFINSSCKTAIGNWLEVRKTLSIKPEHKNALFISRLGKRIGTRSVQQMVEKNLAAAGLSEENFSTHKLRHTAATVMFRDGGVDVRTLQQILGHAQLNTTQIYTHVSDTQMKNAAENNPFSSVTKEKLDKLKK